MSLGELAQELKPKERIQSLSFTESMAYLCTKLSYRDATNTINRFLYRPSVDHVRLRRISDSMQRIGGEISDALAQSTEHILKMYGFHPQTGLPEENARLSSSIRLPAPQEDSTFPLMKIQNVVEDINGSREEKIPFPAEAILIETKSHIEAVFAFHAVILDWYHLKKKCMEYLSMAIKGKEQRNAVLEKLLRYLWVGDVKTASEYLSGLKPSE